MRFDSITYTKAMAIMMVVLGHAFCTTSVESWVDYVHVPAFFFVSGYCFKETHLQSPYKYIKKKLRLMQLSRPKDRKNSYQMALFLKKIEPF